MQLFLLKLSFLLNFFLIYKYNQMKHSFFVLDAIKAKAFILEGCIMPSHEECACDVIKFTLRVSIKPQLK